MVARDLVGRDVRDRRVLDAMGRVPRHLFVPEELRPYAYEDRALDIGFGQTISQPYIVAKMTELLEIQPGDRVLEIGSGCGYQSAVLMELGARVFGVEIVPGLAATIEERLKRLGYRAGGFVQGDGRLGRPDLAPFDAVIVAAAGAIPRALFDQTKVGGRLVAPVGEPEGEQMLRRWRRTEEGWSEEDVFPVRFVPLTGERRVDDVV